MFDLAVIGGGTAGCAAAYIAGKLGLKVILIEKGIHLGGTITSGLVVPVMQAGENQINTVFYNDLTAELHNLGGQITYQNNQGWFNPELAKIALDNLMQKSNVDIRFHSVVHKIKHKNQLIQVMYVNSNILSVYSEAIDVNKKMLLEPIAAKYIIDTTGNCELGKLLNCNFLENQNEFQPMSLRFIMSGINLDEFSSWLLAWDTDRNVTTCEYIDGQVHLSTAYTWDTDKHWALAPRY